MSSFKCPSCTRKFNSEYQLGLHFKSQEAVQCRTVAALAQGNGNVLPLNAINIGAGVFGHEAGELLRQQGGRAVKPQISRDVLGSFSNCNSIRLKVENGWSEQEYQSYIAMVTDTRFDPSTITATTAGKVAMQLDEAVAPVLNTDGMIEKTVTVGGIAYNYFVVKDLAFEAALMLADPRMRGSLFYEAKKVYVPGHEGDPNFRQYNEPWTGDVFAEFAAAVKRKFGASAEYVMIDLHMDGTVVVGLGRGTQLTYVTISITLSNFTSQARYANLKKSGNRIPVAYMPVFVPGPRAAANFNNKRMLSQIIMSDLFSCFLANDGFGHVFDVIDADNVRRLVVPGLGIYHQDLEEFWFRMLMTKGTCPCCKCPRAFFSNCRHIFPARKTCAEMAALWEATAPPLRERVCYLEGFKGLPFWGWEHPRINVYNLYPFDVLHIVDKTVTGDDLFGRCLAGCLQGANTTLTRGVVLTHLQIRNAAILTIPYFQFSDLTHHTKYFGRSAIRLGDDESGWALGSTISMEGMKIKS